MRQKVLTSKERSILRRVVSLADAAATSSDVEALSSALKAIRGLTEPLIAEATRRVSPDRAELVDGAWRAANSKLSPKGEARYVKGREISALAKPLVAARRIERIGHVVNLQSIETIGEQIYNAGILIQSTLPHREPGARLMAWTRRNGNVTLRIQPLIVEKNNEQVAKYPFGVYPRLILFWAVTEVQRLEAQGKDSRTLNMGQSLAEFMRAIGVERGGKQQDAVAEQAKRLFGAQITYEAHDGQGAHGVGGARVSDDAVFWWDPVHPDQASLFPTYVRLSERFHTYLKGRAYPMDMRIVRALKDSSLALDLYAWLTHRVYSVRESVIVPWTSLAKQLGADYGRSRDFADNARKHLRAIVEVWPGLRIDEVQAGAGKAGASGLVLHPSSLSIPPRS